MRVPTERFLRLCRSNIVYSSVCGKTGRGEPLAPRVLPNGVRRLRTRSEKRRLGCCLFASVGALVRPLTHSSRWARHRSASPDRGDVSEHGFVQAGYLSALHRSKAHHAGFMLLMKPEVYARDSG